jgi:hypothetical protein
MLAALSVVVALAPPADVVTAAAVAEAVLEVLFARNFPPIFPD